MFYKFKEVIMKSQHAKELKLIHKCVGNETILIYDREMANPKLREIGGISKYTSRNPCMGIKNPI